MDFQVQVQPNNIITVLVGVSAEPRVSAVQLGLRAS